MKIVLMPTTASYHGKKKNKFSVGGFMNTNSQIGLCQQPTLKAKVSVEFVYLNTNVTYTVKILTKSTISSFKKINVSNNAAQNSLEQL